MKTMKQLKLEFFYIRKAFGQYRHGWRYIWYRYIFAKRILSLQKSLQPPVNFPDLSIHVLTCHRDVVITVWSLASFFKVMPVVGELIIHDDGSLTGHDIAILRRFFPGVRVESTAQFSQIYAAQLKAFPVLAHFRTQYNNFSFKKILDPYIVSTKRMVLVLDSDILWFKEPRELVEAITSGSHSSLMQKNNVAIRPFLKSGASFPESLAWFNAGIVFYRKENFNPDRLAEFFQQLDLEQPKNFHFADQLGYAVCLGLLEALPAASYIIKGQLTDAVIAKHYTGPQRALFYAEGIARLTETIL